MSLLWIGLGKANRIDEPCRVSGKREAPVVFPGEVGEGKRLML